VDETRRLRASVDEAVGRRLIELAAKEQSLNTALEDISQAKRSVEELQLTLMRKQQVVFFGFGLLDDRTVIG
jgi:outer membrane protein TolC